MKSLTAHSRALIQVNEVDAGMGRDEEPSPETMLWRSVLLQALLDATLSPDIVGKTSIDRARAIAWVCASIGVTAEDFEDVCDLAQVDPNLFRDHVCNMIDQGKRFVLRINKGEPCTTIVQTEFSGLKSSTKE